MAFGANLSSMSNYCQDFFFGELSAARSRLKRIRRALDADASCDMILRQTGIISKLKVFGTATRSDHVTRYENLERELKEIREEARNASKSNPDRNVVRQEVVALENRLGPILAAERAIQELEEQMEICQLEDKAKSAVEDVS